MIKWWFWRDGFYPSLKIFFKVEKKLPLSKNKKKLKKATHEELRQD